MHLTVLPIDTERLLDLLTWFQHGSIERSTSLRVKVLYVVHGSSYPVFI